MSNPTEADFLAVLEGNDQAKTIFTAWLGLGYPPARAWAEMRKSGVWQDPHERHRYLQRDPSVWVSRLGNRSGALAGFVGDLGMAGRLLADWLLLTESEVQWLEAVAKRKIVDLRLGADEARQILKIRDESAKDLQAWLKLNGKTVGRHGSLSDDQKALAGYWWRATPVGHQMSGAAAANGSGWPGGR